MSKIFRSKPQERRILVAEDSAHMRSLIQKYLCLEGYVVHVCGDGIEAEELYAEWRPELLITDVIMPRKYGSDVARDLQITDPSLKVILVTGANNSHTEDLKATGEYGTFTFLRKPFKLEDLGLLVKKVLDIQ